MKSYQFLLHLAAIIICFSASAPAAAPKKAVASAFTLTPYVESEYIYFTATAGDQMGKTQRNPSKSKLSESMMSQEAKTLRDDFLKIQNSTELAKLVDRCENEKEYDSLKNADAKYLAAVLASLKPLRGALYRFRPLFSSEKVTHSIVLTFVKNISINIQMISAKNPIEFVFDYLAAPYAENGKMIDQIPSEGQFQEWLDQVAKKNLIKLSNRLAVLNFDQSTVVFDQRIIFGKESFKDDIERFKRISEVEKQMAIAGIEFNISYLNYLRAYSHENVLVLYKKLGNLYGIDGFLFSEVDGVTLKDFSHILKMRDFQNTFTLMTDGPQYMKESYRFLLSGARRVNAIWKETLKRPADTDFLVNTGFFQVDIERGNVNVANFLKLVEGENPDGSTLIRSVATGEVATFNTRAFFENPLKDLKTLMPNKFEENTEKSTTVSLSLGSGKVQQNKNVTYRNFNYGKSTGWDVNSFQAFLPKVQNSNDIIVAGRVMAHSSAGLGRLMGLPRSE